MRIIYVFLRQIDNILKLFSRSTSCSVMFLVIFPLEFIRIFVKLNFGLSIDMYIALIYFPLTLHLIFIYISSRTRSYASIDKVFWLFTLYCIFVIISWWVLSTDFSSTYKQTHVRLAFFGIYKNISFFLAGWGCVWIFKNNKIILFLLAIIYALALNGFDFSSLTMKYARTITGGGFYIVLGDTLAVVTLVSIAITQRVLVKILIVCLTGLVLMSMGSRTNFYLFVMVMPLVVWLESLDKRLFVRVLLLIIIPVAAMFITLSSVDFQSDRFSGLRVFYVFKDDNEAAFASSRARDVMFDDGLAAILDSPIIGDYAGDIRDSGEAGNYIHSYLEVWRQFGIIPFLCILFMLFHCVRVAWRLAFNPIGGGVSKAFVLLTAFIGAEVTFARSYGDAPVFFLFGLCCWIGHLTHPKYLSKMAKKYKRRGPPGTPAEVAN